jgi:hypothetical protein
MPTLLENPPLNAVRSAIAGAGPLEVHLSLYSLKKDKEWKQNLALLRSRAGARHRSHSMTSLPEAPPCESPPRDFGDVPTPTAAGPMLAAGPAPELDLKTLDYLICVLNAEFRGYDFRCARRTVLVGRH